MNKLCLPRFLAITATIAALMLQSAKADVLTFDNSFPHGFLPVQVTSPISEGGVAGNFSMTNTTSGKSFIAWCTDIFHFLQASGNYVLLPQEVVSQVPTGQVLVNALGKFATNHLNRVTDTTSSAAFQIALWEIVTEGHQPLDVTQGIFAVDAGLDANNLANSWLTPAANPLPKAVRVDFWVSIDNPAHQTLVVFSVPEPQSYAMMLAGLALMVLCLHRRSARMQATV